MPDVYFEFTYQGTYVKVAAIDADSGLEVSIVGPISAPQSELEKLALQKLEFVRRRSEEKAPKS
ncbi:MAG: hypothetical protein WAW96_09840 [Alphaproteobacteria bacterium]